MAEQGAAEAFFNGLLREWPACRLRPPARGGGDWDLEAPVAPLSGTLRIAVVHRSRAGRHGLRLPVRFRPDRGVERPIAWPTAVAAVAEALARERDLAPDTVRRFVERVLESTDTIAAALAARGGADGGATAGFLAAEQALHLGHSLHPAPRSAAELRPDRDRFLPGLSSGFRLRWVLARRDAFAFEDVYGRPAEALLRGLGAPREPGWTALPMHPWQARILEASPPVEALRSAGSVRFVDDEAPQAWHPTASVRSLYCPDAPWMLKCSLGARITNSVRTLFPSELARGRDVSRLLRSAAGPRIAALAPGFAILEEPAHLGLRSGGEVLRDSLVILRDNPFRGEAARNAAMLATLCQTDPETDRTPLSPLVGEAAASAGLPVRDAGLAWLGRFVDALPLALVRLRCHLGLLFGAHGQNVVLGLRDGWPARAYFRDCQGTGHVESAHPRLADAAPGIGEAAESIVPDAVGDRLLGYYAVVNGLFGLVAALSRDGLADEDAMFGLVRERLENERASRPPDPSFLHYLLDSPALAAKGNFMTFLEDVLENRGTREQRAIYHDLPNPLCERVPA
ncbi:MAG: IucA/IucC family siderophore biosynthesis protein [Acetobacteraceae bacterium]|nr:IucA/IucC family siderophore biosynthesis protein [Acetobacteraceae bacterium]